MWSTTGETFRLPKLLLRDSQVRLSQPNVLTENIRRAEGKPKADVSLKSYSQVTDRLLGDLPGDLGRPREDLVSGKDLLQVHEYARVHRLEFEALWLAVGVQPFGVNLRRAPDVRAVRHGRQAALGFADERVADLRPPRVYHDRTDRIQRDEHAEPKTKLRRRKSRRADFGHGVAHEADRVLVKSPRFVVNEFSRRPQRGVVSRDQLRRTHRTIPITATSVVHQYSFPS